MPFFFGCAFLGLICGFVTVGVQDCFRELRGEELFEYMMIGGGIGIGVGVVAGLLLSRKQAH